MCYTYIKQSAAIFFTTCYLLIFYAFTTPSAAADFDDILSGFNESPYGTGEENTDDLAVTLAGFDNNNSSVNGQEDHERNIIPDWIQPFASLSFKTSWNYKHKPPEAANPDYRGFSMLKTTVAVGADIDLGSWKGRISGHGFYDGAWAVAGRENYSDVFLNNYENKREVDELYLNGDIGDSFDFKIGRQVVVWGKADNVRVTDILNPLNNQTPGMVDIKYRRLPVTMSKLDYYLGDWNLSGIIIHEISFDKTPVYNSEFFPASLQAPPKERPTNYSLKNQQFAMAANGIFRGWDISFYHANIYDPRGHVTKKRGRTTLTHNRVHMTGITTNIAFGNWLIKGEGAWWQGLEFGTTPHKDFNRADLMAGIEYTGFSETMLSLEMVNRHILDFDMRLTRAPDYAKEDLLQTVIMLSRDFYNDTIKFKILCSLFGAFGEDGAFERIQLAYDFNDNISLTGGVIFYQSGDMISFSNIGDSDRIFFEFKYSL